MIVLKLGDSNTKWLLQLRRFSGEDQALRSASEFFNYINGRRLYIFEMICILPNIGFLYMFFLLELFLCIIYIRNFVMCLQIQWV